MAPSTSTGKTYIVEHLDEELGPWSELEYLAIAQETQTAQGQFCLSSLPESFKIPQSLKDVAAFVAETRSVEDLYANDKSRVCLLDPAASKDLSPEDGTSFDVFLFGGILGMSQARPSLFITLEANMTQGDDPPRGDYGPMAYESYGARLNLSCLRSDIGAQEEGLRR
jgi:ribosome biogenesis SPOUT family RNA methylase Rps3